MKKGGGVLCLGFSPGDKFNPHTPSVKKEMRAVDVILGDIFIVTELSFVNLRRSMYKSTGSKLVCVRVWIYRQGMVTTKSGILYSPSHCKHGLTTNHLTHC